MFFENQAFVFPSFQQFLLKRILVFSYKMVFIKNEAALLCVTMRERARASTYSYNQVYNFLIYLLSLKSSVFVVHFSNAFWHGNEAFPKGSSQNEIVPPLVIFHLPCSTRVAFVSHSCCSCLTRVARVARVQRSCYKLDQIAQLQTGATQKLRKIMMNYKLMIHIYNLL